MARKFKNPKRVDDYEREEKIDFHKVIWWRKKCLRTFQIEDSISLEQLQDIHDSFEQGGDDVSPE